MEGKKTGISLENKLLSTSRFQGGGLLTSSNLGYSFKSPCIKGDLSAHQGDSKGGINECLGKKQGVGASFSLKNDLLTGSVARTLTTNRLLQGASRSLLGKTSTSKEIREVTKDESKSLKAEGFSKLSLPNKSLKRDTSLLDAGNLKSSLLATPSKHFKGAGMSAMPQNTKGNYGLSLLKSEKILPNRGIEHLQSKMTREFKSQFQSDKKGEMITDVAIESDVVFSEEPNTLRPFYELSFDNDDFSNELVKRSDKVDYFDSQESQDLEKKEIIMLNKQKMEFLNVVSVAIIQQPNFYSKHDDSRVKLLNSVQILSDLDPEFVLKVALYSRRELNIRTGSNFILAAAAFHKECRPYLKKYFCSSIMLPSDWIEVAEFYQTLHDKDINFGSLPTALRKVMTEKFSSFDEYQLAKYNKDKSKQKKDKASKVKPEYQKEMYVEMRDSSESGSESEEEIQRKSFTLKQLIRKLHIFEPVYPVMCLVGKKYPLTAEEFRGSRLEGLWEEEKAGKRMKLPIPETWETQLSLKGNKASTWEQLLDNKKLPFMAMLRNLRNMLQAGISNKHHNMIIKRLSNEESVIRSKQFPFQFFSAYDALNTLDEEYKRWEEKAINGELGSAASVRGGRYGRGRARGRGGGGGRGRGRQQISQLSDLKYDSDLIKKYRKALDTALRISCVHNITPMPGSSIIICDVGETLDGPCSSAKSFGKTKTVLEVGLLLGLMAKYSCEDCKLMLFHNGKFILCEIQNQETILTNLMKTLEKAKEMRYEIVGEDIEEYLQNLIFDQIKVDNLMFFSNFVEESARDLRKFLQLAFIDKYRLFVNPDMLLVDVNLTGGRGCFSSSSQPKNISIGTYSDQILRFVAERGNSTLLSHVDNIDLAFNLQNIKISKKRVTKEVSNDLKVSPLIEKKSPWWRSVRVFISSTFRDMHGERDLLTRYVFPELRARAMQYLISIYEIDLRWGITEEQSKSESAVEICLSEVLRADIFIGILGSRYGWIPKDVDLERIPGCERLQGHSEGKSITELEMNLFALTRVDYAVGRSFFYIRDAAFLPSVPEQYETDFRCEDEESESKLASLKKDIRRSGLEQHKYSCSWGGVVDGKPIVSNLEDFGNRVLNNVWTAVTHFVKETDKEKNVVDDVNTHNPHEAFAEKAAENFVGRKTSVKQCLETIANSNKTNCGVLMVAGKSGSGKTSFMARLFKDFAGEKSVVPCFFADAVPDKRNIHEMVKSLFLSMLRHIGKSLTVPDTFRELQNEFTKLLEETSRQADEKLVMFIDGIDLVETPAKVSLLGWLPDPVPKGILFVVSCHQDGACAKILESRRKGVESIRIGPLDMMERVEFVRKLLKKHRKELDESAFNNQMKLLVSKREASLPIFLKFACEDLRFFGVYEKVSDHLRKLAQTVPLLLQSISNRSESDHGKDLVAWSLLVLFVSRQALSEDELYEIICFMESCKNFSTQQLNSSMLVNENIASSQEISRVEFAMLTRSLKGFIQQSEKQSLQLSFFDVRTLVKQKYLRAAGSDYVTRIHRVLAAYYKRRSFDRNWIPGDAKALSEVIHHMAAGGLWQDLQETLCSLSFIYVRFQAGLGSKLLEDFLANVDDLPLQQERQRQSFLENPRVQDYQAFVSRNVHILNQYPVLVIQQALNDPCSQNINADAMQCSRKHNVFQSLNKQSKPSPLKRTWTFNEAILSMDISADGSAVACGTQGGTVRLFDVATGNDVGSFIGHANSITSCCFVGPQRLVSASLDCTLSVWDVSGGHRIHHLKSHRRAVTCCVRVPGSQQVVSVSLDCQAILWNIKSGTSVMSFKSGNRPYNSVACDPTGRLVALGGWDCLIKVWDLLTNKRQALLKGHESAVRAVAFSPSGSHIVSSALLGDVFLWAAQSGTLVGKFSFGALGLNSIRYTADGMQMLGACSDKTIKVWSGSLGQPCGTDVDDIDEKHDWALSVAVDSKGEYFYVGYNSGRVTSFHYAGNGFAMRCKLHKSSIRSLCLSKDGKFLVTASDDGTAKIVFLKDTSHVTLEGHSAGLRCVQMTSSQIATGSEDYTIILWDTLFIEPDSSPKPSAVLRHHTGYVTCCAFSPCETRLLSGSTDKSIIIWDVVTKKPLHVLNECHRDWVNACAWSDVGDFVVTGSNDFTLKLWDAKTGTQKYEFFGNTTPVNGVAYKFGCVASTAFDGSLRLWTHKGAEITTIQAHNERANGLFLWKPDEEEISDWDVEDTSGMTTNQLIKSKQPKLDKVDVITVSDDGTAKKWKPFMPHFIENLSGHTDVVASIVPNPSGTDVFSCSYDKTIKCWDKTMFESSDGAHATEVKCVRISDDGRNAISCGRDGFVSVWSLNPCKLISAFQASTKSVNSACFINDEWFATGDDFGSLCFWKMHGYLTDRVRASVGDVTRPITAMERRGEILVVAACSFCIVYLIDKDSPKKWAHGGLNMNNNPCDRREGIWILDLDISGDGKNITAAVSNDVIWNLTVSWKEMKKKSPSWKPVIKVEFDSSAEVSLNSDVLPESQYHSADSLGTRQILAAKRLTNGFRQCSMFGNSEGFVGILLDSGLFDSAIPQPVLQENDCAAFKAHDKAVTTLVMMNNILVTGSADTTIKVWDLSPLESLNHNEVAGYKDLLDTVRKGGIKQIGLYFCRGPVTKLDVKDVNGDCIIFAGDKTGNVEVLQFFK